MPDRLTRGFGRILLTTDAVGGVWRYTIDLARGLCARGVSCSVAILGPEPTAAQRAEAAGLDLIVTGLPLDWTAGDPAALAHATGALRALAETATSVHLHAAALAGSTRWPVPLIAVAHSDVATWWDAVHGGPLPADLRWRADATAAGLRASDMIIAPTQAHAAATQAAYGPLPITVVHNGTPGLPFPLAGERKGGRSNEPRLSANGATLTQPSPASGRGLLLEPSLSGEEQGEGLDPRSVLTAGRLWDPGKNVAFLDRIAPDLDAPIRAAGPTQGPNGAAITLPNLQLLGTLDADGMRAAYAAASVYVSLARYEPFGLSVLEAAQAGLRLVLSDIPTFRELWDGAATFVSDERMLLTALRTALDGRGDGGARVRAGRYGMDATVEATLAVHRRVRVPA